MFNLSTKQTVGIAVVFSLILWATRGQHVASMMSLPDATWAIALILGFLLSPILFALVLAQAFVIDYLAMGDYLFNLAYAALIPAYLSLWLAQFSLNDSMRPRDQRRRWLINFIKVFGQTVNAQAFSACPTR